MQSSNKSVAPLIQRLPRRQMLFMGTAVTGMLMVPSAFAQSVDARHWQGSAAVTRQPEHVVASTNTEWRSLWSRVGSPAPDMFESGRMNAVGIFLGRRGGEGYAVNVISTARRRDRIVVVFEERMPAEMMMAQRSSGPRPVATAPPASALPCLVLALLSQVHLHPPLRDKPLALPFPRTASRRPRPACRWQRRFCCVRKTACRC